MAIILNWAGCLYGNFFYPIFALPAARLAGFFFNSVAIFDDKGLIVIPLAASLIQVTPDCSGYGFFCLITAICMVFYQDVKWRMALIGKVALTLLIAYLITIITNGFRIISAYKVHLIAAKILPASAQNLAHLIVGVTIFFTVLLIVYLILEKRGCYDRTRQ